MNSTANKTTVSVTVTDAKPKADLTIKSKIVYGRGGRKQVIQTVRGIQI